MTGRDWQALLRGPVLLLAPGTAAVTAALSPGPLPWPVRLAAGAAGTVLCAVSLRAAWHLALHGADRGAS